VVLVCILLRDLGFYPLSFLFVDNYSWMLPELGVCAYCANLRFSDIIFLLAQIALAFYRLKFFVQQFALAH